MFKYKILESLIATTIIIIVGMVSVAMILPIIGDVKEFVDDFNMQQQNRVNQCEPTHD